MASVEASCKSVNPDTATWEYTMKRLLATLVLLALTTPLSAQWLSLPTPGVPRTADGAPDLSAPVFRTPKTSA